MSTEKSPQESPSSTRPQRRDDRWRQANFGRLLSNALRRFEARVIDLLTVAGHADVTLTHINATRHLDLDGTRLTDMASRASMTKQSMSELVEQLEALGLVARRPDPADGRARLVYFTPQGLNWLDDFRRAVHRAETEVATMIGAEALRDTKQALGRYLPPKQG